MADVFINRIELDWFDAEGTFPHWLWGCIGVGWIPPSIPSRL